MDENPQTIEVSVAMTFRFTLNDEGRYDLQHVSEGTDGLFSDAESGFWNEDAGDWQRPDTPEQRAAFDTAWRMARFLAQEARR